jgi:hypothetical protein
MGLLVEKCKINVLFLIYSMLLQACFKNNI